MSSSLELNSAGNSSPLATRMLANPAKVSYSKLETLKSRISAGNRTEEH